MAKHFIIYYKEGTGTFITTEPRPWARENQAHFPDYTFTSEDFPNTNTIINYLIQVHNFQMVINTPSVVLIINHNINNNL